MTLDLKYLALVAVFTALMWLPYIFNVITVRGLIDTVGYGTSSKPLANWATRMKAAHYNAIENLAVFAPLVLIAHVSGVTNENTIMACMIYFWARVIHYFVYAFAVPWVRTLSFAVGVVCQIFIAIQILS